jgi:hypothetical protein
LLQNIIEDADMVETIMEGCDDDNTTKLTAKQERRIVTQCLYLWKAYEIAVQCMNAWTWKECCAEAIKSLCDCVINYVGNEVTIRRWHIYFRKNETFPNPLGCSRKLLEPKVFDFFLELKSKIHEFYAHPDNQPSMSSESVAAEIRQNILPKCYEDLLAEIDDPDGLPTYNELLQLLDPKWVCPSMAWRWLQLMGYKYDENRRCYYTDGHEREDVMKDRNKCFLVEYYKLERRAHRWVQLREEMANKLEETLSKPPLQQNVSYNYTTPDGVQMREYHLDTHKTFGDFVSANNKQFGGDLSVRLRAGERLAVCLSKVNIKMCRRFLGKARGYMLGYHHQALEVEDGREEVKSFERNEKIQKIYRSHRDALTFSGEFISQVMRECINVDG